MGLGGGEYKGVKFSINEEGKFYARIEEDQVEGQSLDELKKAIDKAQKKVFKRFKIYRKYNRWNQGKKWRECTATSFNPETGDLWVSTKDGGKEKLNTAYSGSRLVADTAENRSLVDKANELQDTIERLEEEIKEVESRMTFVQIQKGA